MKDKVKYIPVLLILMFYLLVLLQAVSVARAQNDVSFIILGFTAPILLLIAIFIATMKLIKNKEED